MSWQSIMMSFHILAVLMIWLPDNHQWVIVIVLPLIRELNIRSMNRLAYNSASGYLVGISITIPFTINVVYYLFLFYVLESFITEIISNRILGIDFVSNHYNDLKNIGLRKLTTEKEEEIINLIQELVIDEISVPVDVFYYCAPWGEHSYSGEY